MLAGWQGAGLVSSFEALFPGLKLNLTVDLSKYHDSNIDRSWLAGNEYVDVAILQTVQDFPRWRDQQRLLNYKPSNFEDIYLGEKDLNGAFNPIGICKSILFIWNYITSLTVGI